MAVVRQSFGTHQKKHLLMRPKWLYPDRQTLRVQLKDLQRYVVLYNFVVLALNLCTRVIDRRS
uniref:Uncharacterized protein n=3 Tax=Oryza TaxID=4527 RepID=Q2R5F8_ORYSJ|nr:hypothetical protein [Oryza sativa Japonica Group]ABA93287.1 hypothetical protein LOC_Os11g25150 [Oryza sativa Japonica Group]